MLVYTLDRARLSAGLDGRGILTEDGSFSDRTLHQALLAASYAFRRLRPGIHARLPLDKDMRELINGTFGVSLQVELGR